MHVEGVNCYMIDNDIVVTRVLSRLARRGGFVIYVRMVRFVYFHFVHQSSMTTMKGVLDIGTVIFYDDLFSWKLEKMAYFPAKAKPFI